MNELPPNSMRLVAPDGSLTLYGFGIFQTVDGEGDYRVQTCTCGNPPQTNIIGLLQAVLDNERRKMENSWIAPEMADD